MALNDTATEEALTEYIDAIATPEMTAEQKNSVRDAFRPMFRSLVNTMRRNAVVVPSTMSAPAGGAGGSISGTGKLE